MLLESPQLVHLSISLLTLTVPQPWLALVGPSAPPGVWPLREWLQDLVLRFSFFDRVLAGGLAKTATYWLGAFFSPAAFLSMIQQVAKWMQALSMAVENVLEGEGAKLPIVYITTFYSFANYKVTSYSKFGSGPWGGGGGGRRNCPPCPPPPPPPNYSLAIWIPESHAVPLAIVIFNQDTHPGEVSYRVGRRREGNLPPPPLSFANNQPFLCTALFPQNTAIGHSLH